MPTSSKPCYACLRCGQLITSQVTLMNHLRQHRREDWAERLRQQHGDVDSQLDASHLPDRLPYVCTHCNGPFNNASEFNNHMHGHHRVQIRLRAHDNILKALEAELHHHAQVNGVY